VALEQPSDTLVAAGNFDYRMASHLADRLVTWKRRPVAIFRIAHWILLKPAS
jgi:hypothetical protein